VKTENSHRTATASTESAAHDKTDPVNEAEFSGFSLIRDGEIGRRIGLKSALNLIGTLRRG
jgi:hypothetical protein